MACDGGRDPFQDGSHRIEQEQLFHSPNRAASKKTGVKKMAKVKNISTRYLTSQEKTGRGEENSRSDRQDDQRSDQNGQPQHAPSQRNAQEDQHDRQYEAGDEKIHELERTALKGKITLEVNLGNEVRVCDQAVGPESDRGDEEGPGNRPDRYVH